MRGIDMRFAFFLVSLLAGEALACGYCVEDKIAAVYDYAAVQQAASRKQTTVYFAIDGRIGEQAPKLQKLVSSVPGVQQGSARVSVEAAALAVAFDPARVSLGVLQRNLEAKLRPLGLSLLLLDAK